MDVLYERPRQVRLDAREVPQGPLAMSRTRCHQLRPIFGVGFISSDVQTTLLESQLSSTADIAQL